MDPKIDTGVPVPAKGFRQNSLYALWLPWFDRLTGPDQSFFIPVLGTNMEPVVATRHLQKRLAATAATYRKRNPAKAKGAKFKTVQVTEDGVPGVRVFRY